MKREIFIYNETKIRAPKKFIEDLILKVLDFLKLKQPVELAVLIVGAKEIKRLNKIWRKKDYTPDELSFGLNSHLSVGETKFAKKQDEVLELGEIILNARKISNKNYLSKLLIHSLLHLLGYNHEKSSVQAKKMGKLETKILKYVA